MSSKTRNWTEADFRRELKRIDDLVKEKKNIELVGSQLDIEFSKTTRVLALYNGCQMKFRFSLAFFNSDVPEACAIDVIRHEYAHYYAHVVLGHLGGHGAHFKAACKVVGAVPSTYYTKMFEETERNREDQASKEYISKLSIGQYVKHPAFGRGIITEIDNQKTTAVLSIDFPGKGIKQIDELWLRKRGCILDNE